MWHTFKMFSPLWNDFAHRKYAEQKTERWSEVLINARWTQLEGRQQNGHLTE